MCNTHPKANGPREMSTFICFIIYLITLNLFFGIASFAFQDTCALDDPTLFSFLPTWAFIGVIAPPIYLILAYIVLYVIINQIDVSSSVNRRLHGCVYILLAMFDLIWLIIGSIYFGVVVPECGTQALGYFVSCTIIIKSVSFLFTCGAIWVILF